MTVEKLASASVTSVALANASVQEAHIANGSVTVDKLASGSVTTASVATAAIGTTQLADHSVTADKLTPGSVTTVALTDGSITPAKLAAGSVGGAQLSQGSVTLQNLAAHIGGATLNATFANPSPDPSDQFGFALAIVGGDKLLVGAPSDDTTAMDAGAAYLLNADGTLLTAFSNPTPGANDQFGYAVAAVGSDKVLIGAVYDSSAANAAGAAYLFQMDGTLLTTFNSPTPSDFCEFGGSLAAVGADKVLIGARSDDTGAMDSGIAYLFHIDGTLLTTFNNPTPQAFENFGQVVAAVGPDKVLVSAPQENSQGMGVGAAYLFDTDGSLLATFNKPAPADFDNFGVSLAPVGADRFLIGAPADDTGAQDAGAAYLFHIDGTLLSTFHSPNPEAFARFGVSLTAIGANKAIIGSRWADLGAMDSGAAYLFRMDGSLLTPISHPAPATASQFGATLAAFGDGQAIVGAYWDDTGAMDSGAVFRFTLDANYLPGLVSENVRNGAITTASLADGAVTANKIGGVLNPSQIPGLNGNQIASGSLTGNHLSDSSIGPEKLTPTAAVKTLNNLTGAVTLSAGANVTLSPNGNSIEISTPGGGGWGFGGNSVNDGDHLGTMNGQPLILKTEGYRAFRMERGGSGFNSRVNIIGGADNNVVTGGVHTGTIGGGNNNKVTDYGGTIGGGMRNEANGRISTIGGGISNEANGNDSTIGGGGGNDANGHSSTIGGGTENDANGTWTAIAGGNFNAAAGLAASVGGGNHNNAAGDYSAVGGGDRNNASVTHSSIAGGEQNAASGAHSSIGGGEANTASGAHSVIGGGNSNTATGDFSTVPGGRNAKASSLGQMAYANGRFAADGDAQTSVFLLRGTTNTSTPTQLGLNGWSTGLPLPIGATWVFDILVTARNNFQYSAGYRITGVVENVSGTTSFVGTPNITVLGEDISSWSASPYLDDTDDTLSLKVEGSSGNIIRWVAVVRTAEVIH